MRAGEKTKEKLLNVSFELIMENGLTGTSIDKILQKADITKGSFFYHFKDKDELILELIKRFLEKDKQVYFNFMERTERICGSDPLQKLLGFVGIFIDEFSNLESPYPGCLYAAYLYQHGMVSEKSMEIVKEGLLFWRSRMADLISEASKMYPPKLKIDNNQLADLFTTILEGSFIVSKTLNEPKIPAEHLIHYQSYLRLIFSNKT